MMIIALTGNYTYFNLLVMVLCMSAVFAQKNYIKRPLINIKLYSPIVALFIIICGVTFDLGRFLSKNTYQNPIYQAIQPFRMVNTYGLFTVMTKKRYEVEVWASLDGNTWKAYEFKAKANHKRYA